MSSDGSAFTPALSLSLSLSLSLGSGSVSGSGLWALGSGSGSGLCLLVKNKCQARGGKTLTTMIVNRLSDGRMKRMKRRGRIGDLKQGEHTK